VFISYASYLVALCLLVITQEAQRYLALKKYQKTPALAGENATNIFKNRINSES